MGFKPSESAFINAIVAVCTTSNKSWEQKLEIYRSWGWSENDFSFAFRKCPRCMTLSIDNITRKMDLFVNNMGWEPSAIAKVSTALAYSLENRIIPRWSVIKVLLLKGLIKEKIRLSTMVSTSDKYFIDNYVTKYKKQVPHLLNIFQGKIGLSDPGF
ncbi:hypothetical protein Dsin_025327 [Dipteronia sinensis]|uniref:Uncharacterized protein n=1 Tax=Dipteronia sinensis TaxID=43782 RepID=A0AAD9ZVM2_9ROSI|nr:hypothetical protein Dsin_025327 [Dipteronia sinensis]